MIEGSWRRLQSRLAMRPPSELRAMKAQYEEYAGDIRLGCMCTPGTFKAMQHAEEALQCAMDLRLALRSAGVGSANPPTKVRITTKIICVSY